MQSNNNFWRNVIQPYAELFSWQVPGLLTSTSVSINIFKNFLINIKI